LIVTKELTKTFGRIVAVSKLTLTIQEGEIFGLLGPNGAGKTTTINMLTTIVRPSGGEATIAGFDVIRQPHEVRARTGIVFQDPTLDTILTGWENLNLHAHLYGLTAQERKERITALLNLLDLTGRAHDLVRTYSGGMRRRLELARGLLHRPAVLYLDEPTLGLDPQTREHTWAYIRETTQREGTTILLTTHYLDEAERMCNRIAIMDGGEVIAIDTPERLIARWGGDLVSLEAEEVSEETIRAFPFVTNLRSLPDHWEISVVDAAHHLPALLEAAKGIRRVEVQKPTLNDVFLQLTGRSIREEAVEDRGGWLETAARYQQRGK